jgi:hypothetical protein
LGTAVNDSLVQARVGARQILFPPFGWSSGNFERAVKNSCELMPTLSKPILAPEDRKRKWVDDEEAREIFAYAKSKAEGLTVLPCYAVSDSAADTIVDIAATVGASYVILGKPEET